MDVAGGQCGKAASYREPLAALAAVAENWGVRLRELCLLLERFAVPFDELLPALRGLQGCPGSKGGPWRRRAREAFRARYPEVVRALPEGRAALRADGWPVVEAVLERGLGLAPEQQSFVVDRELGAVCLSCNDGLRVVVDGREVFSSLAVPKIVDAITRVWLARQMARAPQMVGAPWNLPVVHGLAVLVPELFMTGLQYGRMVDIWRKRAAKSIHGVVQAWCREQQARAAPTVALQKKAFKALGKVPWFLRDDESFLSLAPPALLRDLFCHPVAWVALIGIVQDAEEDFWESLPQDDPERGFAARHSAVFPDAVRRAEDWLAWFAPKGESRPPKSIRKVLMQWPSQLPVTWAAYLQGVHATRRPTSYLEVIYGSVLPSAWPGLDHHPARDAVLRATDAEIREVFALARERFSLRTLRSVRCHETIVAYALDDPRPYGGRWPGLFRRAVRWHDEQRWTRARAQEVRATFPPLGVELVGADGIAVHRLNSVEEVLRESREMRHCVGSYVQRDVELFLFHVSKNGQEATVQTDATGRVVQAFGPRNTKNGASRWAWSVSRLFDGVAAPADVRSLEG